MENDDRDSNTLSNSPGKLQQFQWLINTLLELDEKIMAMIRIIQEEDNSFIQRDEMYQKKTLELMEMGKEFHKSYHLFAEAYEELNSESSETIQSESSSSMNSFCQDKWYELSFQVLKLITENQSQQAELISRNKAKRETIKDLSSQLEELKNENMGLHDQLRRSKPCVNKNQSQFSKLKQMILGKFLGVDAP